MSSRWGGGRGYPQRQCQTTRGEGGGSKDKLCRLLPFKFCKKFAAKKNLRCEHSYTYWDKEKHWKVNFLFRIRFFFHQDLETLSKLKFSSILTNMFRIKTCLSKMFRLSFSFFSNQKRKGWNMHIDSFYFYAAGLLCNMH